MGIEVGEVIAVARSAEHRFSKPTVDTIRLVTGLGAEGDAHAGQTVKHRSRVRAHPRQPNLRQVHLVQSELFDELRDEGFQVKPGDIGENVTTRGLDLLALPRGAQLRLGREAVVEVTGLRNPCVQLDTFHPGLMVAVLHRDEHGQLIRKAGIMGVVLTDGEVRAGDPITVELPSGRHEKLDRV